MKMWAVCLTYLTDEEGAEKNVKELLQAWEKAKGEVQIIPDYYIESSIPLDPPVEENIPEEDEEKFSSYCVRAEIKTAVCKDKYFAASLCIKNREEFKRKYGAVISYPMEFEREL